VPRIAYVPADISEPREVVDAIRKRRGGTLIHLDRLLLHSPPLAAAWNVYLGAIRTQTSLPPRLREIAMCGVAVLNGAEYEFFHHAPVFLKAGGTPAQVEALRDVARAVDSALFDAAERSTLRLTLEMTRDVRVADATFAAARSALPTEQALVELVATIATYNMVSRFLVALGVNPEDRPPA
jgi:alkylhydroperoxidase family enzyme